MGKVALVWAIAWAAAGCGTAAEGGAGADATTAFDAAAASDVADSLAVPDGSGVEAGGALADAVADAAPDAVPDAATADLPLACTTTNPAGCFSKPKDTGCPKTAQGETQKCVQNGSQDGCFPFSCQCDAATGTWKCDPSRWGGVCKPLCEVLAPTVHCCSDGKYAKPDCKDGSFTCPAGSYARPLAGCGPYAGAATPGLVSCPSTGAKYDVCPANHGCCFGVVTQCWQQATLAKSCYAAIACDDQADCAGGQTCCVTGVAVYVGTACVAASECAAPGKYVVCQADGDCPSGKTCCTKAKGGKYGVCLDPPC